MGYSARKTAPFEAYGKTSPPRSGGERRRETNCNPIWLSNASREWENVLHLGKKLHFKAKEIIPPVQDGQRGV